MKLIYTHENRYLVHNIQNIINNASINTTLKNEYAAGGAGDLVPHETWLELWVSDTDYDKAMPLINDTNNGTNNSGWVCEHCNESNNASFDFCWNCQSAADHD